MCRLIADFRVNVSGQQGQEQGLSPKSRNFRELKSLSSLAVVFQICPRLLS